MVCQYSSQTAVRPVPPTEVSRPAVVTNRPSIQSALKRFVWDAIMTTHLNLMQRIRLYAAIPLRCPQKS